MHHRRSDTMHDLNVLALLKGQERFVFVYDEDSRREILDSIRDHAASPTVALNWFDAAVLVERARVQEARTKNDTFPARLSISSEPQ
jgi:hypothetical protein